MPDHALHTPIPVVDLGILRRNLATMAATHAGSRLRPHVKAHKCTSIAREQVRAGHSSFTCATVREMTVMARSFQDVDLLLANETIDTARLAELAALQDRARITVAVDSPETIHAAAAAGIADVLIDVNVGLPRCGVSPDAAGKLADAARSRGLTVRGVMGYEGHLMMVSDRGEKRSKVHEAMHQLALAHRDVGGDIVSAGGTGTWDMFEGTIVNEVQAGSYALMDSQYAQLGIPFAQALWIVGTVISVGPSWAVADVGLKSLGMDHGNPAIDGHSVWFCSDEHVTFSPAGDAAMPRVGDQVRIVPAHIAPTLAMHERILVLDNDTIVDEWPVDMRGW